MVGSQIDTLIPDPFFGHNLCFKYSNESYKLILDIYVLKDFQWYKELFSPIIFGPWNCFLKIHESVKTPIPKVGNHLRVWGFIPSHCPTLPGTWNVTLGLHSWPKARVATCTQCYLVLLSIFMYINWKGKLLWNTFVFILQLGVNKEVLPLGNGNDPKTLW